MDKNDIKKAMNQAQEMQMQLMKAQEELAYLDVTGSSKNKQVKINMSAQGEVKTVKVDPKLMANGVEVLEASIMEAIKDANHKAAELTKERLGAISSQLGI